MAKGKNILQLLMTVLFLKIILAEIDSTAVLLGCIKGSSINDLKRTIPPYHTIDNCIRKIRIALNISNSGKTPPELAYTFVGHLADPDTGAKMYLLNSLVIRLRQEQVLLTYPFHYLSAVNAKAKEVVLNYENRKNFTGCDDISLINPTCGLEYRKGKPVPFSEGFCCFCPEIPVNEKHPRGGQDCSLDVGDPFDVEKQKYKASAHCLQFNDIWYSVSALTEPFILHETFLQVYIEKHFKNGSSSWFALTHDEDFVLSPQNTHQYDDNRTIVLSYLTFSPNENAISIPISQRRLLIPQPMPAVELSKLPIPVRNGANDYLLLPKDIIDPEGDVCDSAGVSYEAFFKQPDRCKVPKDTCLKKQPLDFWNMDDEKRAAGGKGDYLLENFGIPYKDPIIVDPETKEHWLALEYHEPHRTVIFLEINADEITILTVGKHAQISKILSSTVSKAINILVSVLNSGLMPATFNIQVIKCAYGVPDSGKISVKIPPQTTEDAWLAIQPGSASLDEKFACTVEVSSKSYGVVASRKVIIHPSSRCVCNFHCECACLSESLKCKQMSEEDYQAAGFRGSLPILTAKPPYRMWLAAHPFLALLAIILFLLLLGLIKSICGLAGIKTVGDFGMDVVLYRRKKIKNYIQPDIKHIKPVYDDEGYPIHPDTKERVKVTGEELLFTYNLLFCFFWPCLKCRQCFKKASNKNKKISKPPEDITEDSGSEKDNKYVSKRSEKKIPKKKFWTKTKNVAQEIPLKGAVSSRVNGRHSDEHISDHNVEGHEKISQPIKPTPLSESNFDETMLSSGPAAHPTSKEVERWRKGKSKIDALKK